MRITPAVEPGNKTKNSFCRMYVYSLRQRKGSGKRPPRTYWKCRLLGVGRRFSRLRRFRVRLRIV